MGWSEVEQAFNEAVEERVIPGATLVVRRGAEVAFEGAFGFRSIEPSRSPAKIETVYDLSSLTKALATTVAVMMLARDGKFRLDDRVTRFFPNFGVHGKTTVTFRHLLAHCSGLAAWRPFYQRIAEIEKSGRVNFMASHGAKEFAYEEIHREKPEAAPATKTIYSDLGLHPAGRDDRKGRRRRAQPILPRENLPPAGPARDRLHRHLTGPLAPAGAGRRHVRADRNLSFAQAAAGRRS